MKLEKGRNAPTKNSYYRAHHQPQAPKHQGQPLKSATYHGKLANALVDIAGMTGQSKANRGRPHAQTQGESTASASAQIAHSRLGASQRAYDT